MSYRKPGIRSAWTRCPACDEVTEHRCYTTSGSGPRWVCLVCARERTRIRGLIRKWSDEEPAPKPVSEFDFKPGEAPCPRCFLTTCDCEG